jgi:hypothetical protein
MSLLLRKLLSRYLRLGAAEGDPDPAAEPTDAAADPPTDEGGGEEALDDVFDGVEEGIGAGESEDPKEALKAERARRENVERELNETRQRQSTSAQTSSRDPESDREDAQIADAQRNGATEDQIRWLRWQIDSNRKIRASDQRSQAALNESRDIADKTSFEQLAVTKPKTYKQYRDRIEKAVSDLRASGQNVPPRMAMLRFMIGDDIMNGKLKPKAARAAAPGNASSVERKRLPNARSDVSARGGGQTERDKRRARLEGQPI